MGCHESARKQTGATLIEVLVAALVGSIGLLGTASLLSLSANANHAAYENTQAGLAAQTLIDSMHINVPAVVSGNYDGAIDALTTAATDCGKQGCAPTQRAAYDRARIGRAISAALPNAKASLRCPAAAISSGVTYDGLCRLEIDWSQRGLTSADKSGVQSLVWMFTP